MKLNTFKTIFLILLIFYPSVSLAGDFDGSKLLVGSIEKVLEINQFRVSDDVDPDIVGLPRKFFIDIQEKRVLPSKESMIRRISSIKHVAHIENKLILQGTEEGVENVEDGLAWSMAISKKTGKFVLSASGDGRAYVVFGSCTALE